jgi:hypothetical protein
MLTTYAVVLTLLLLKHFIADMPLQTYYMAFNKGTYGHRGGLQHAGIHGLLTLLVLLIILPWHQISFLWLLTLVVLEVVVHYHIDYAKMNLDKRFDSSFLVKDESGNVTGRTITSMTYYYLLVGDQCLHVLTYIWLGYLLLA